MADIKCARNTCFAFFFLSLISFIIAFATPFWYNTTNLRYGLWLTCLVDFLFFPNECQSYDDTVADIQATRAMMCIALAAYAVAFVLYCVWVSKSPSYLREYGAGPIGTAALALSIVGGLCQLIAVAVFGAYHSEIDQVLSWSFIMACTSCACILITSVATMGTTVCCFHPETTGQGVSSVPPTTMTIITTTAPPGTQGPPQPAGYGNEAYAGQPTYPPPPQTAYPAQQYPQNTAYPPPAYNPYNQEAKPTYM